MNATGLHGRFAWERALRESEVSGNQLFVLLTLATYMSSGGEHAHPGLARLSAETGLGKSTIRRHLKDAIDGQWLVRKSRGGHRTKEFQAANEYAVSIPSEALTSEPLASERSAQSDEPKRSILPIEALTSEPPSSKYTKPTTTTKEAAAVQDLEIQALYEALDEKAQVMLGARIVLKADLLTELERLRHWPPEQLAGLAPLWTNWPFDIVSPTLFLAQRLQHLPTMPRAVSWSRERNIATNIECDHGEPRGCNHCAPCRRRVPDVDGILCKLCSIAASA